MGGASPTARALTVAAGSPAVVSAAADTAAAPVPAGLGEGPAARAVLPTSGVSETIATAGRAAGAWVTLGTAGGGRKESASDFTAGVSRR